MFDIGRICMKIAGRDAGKYCVVVDILDKHFVLVDGQTRRRKVNMLHLEPTRKIADIKKNASNKDVVKALVEQGFAAEEKKAKSAEEKAAKKPKQKQ